MSDKTVNEFVDAFVQTLEAVVEGDSAKSKYGPTNLQLTYNELESPPKQSPKEILEQDNENSVLAIAEQYIKWLKKEHPKVYTERRSDIMSIIQKAQ